MAECLNFDLYCVLVENVFGSILVSFFGIALIIVLIFTVTRTSPSLWIFYLLLFGAVFLTLYMGPVLAFILFVFIIIYFIAGVYRFFVRSAQ